MIGMAEIGLELNRIRQISEEIKGLDQSLISGHFGELDGVLQRLQLILRDDGNVYDTVVRIARNATAISGEIKGSLKSLEVFIDQQIAEYERTDETAYQRLSAILERMSKLLGINFSKLNIDSVSSVTAPSAVTGSNGRTSKGTYVTTGADYSGAATPFVAAAGAASMYAGGMRAGGQFLTDAHRDVLMRQAEMEGRTRDAYYATHSVQKQSNVALTPEGYEWDSNAPIPTLVDANGDYYIANPSGVGETDGKVHQYYIGDNWAVYENINGQMVERKDLYVNTSGQVDAISTLGAVSVDAKGKPINTGDNYLKPFIHSDNPLSEMSPDEYYRLRKEGKIPKTTIKDGPLYNVENVYKEDDRTAIGEALSIEADDGVVHNTGGSNTGTPAGNNQPADVVTNNGGSNAGTPAGNNQPAANGSAHNNGGSNTGTPAGNNQPADVVTNNGGSNAGTPAGNNQPAANGGSARNTGRSPHIELAKAAKYDQSSPSVLTPSSKASSLFGTETYDIGGTYIDKNGRMLGVVKAGMVYDTSGKPIAYITPSGLKGITPSTSGTNVNNVPRSNPIASPVDYGSATPGNSTPPATIPGFENQDTSVFTNPGRPVTAAPSTSGNSTPPATIPGFENQDTSVFTNPGRPVTATPSTSGNSIPPATIPGFENQDTSVFTNPGRPVTATPSTSGNSTRTSSIVKPGKVSSTGSYSSIARLFQ